MKKLMVLIFTLGTLLSTVAKAQTTQWVNGTTQNLAGINCSIFGSTFVETMLTGTARYLRTTDFTAPATGDGSYVSILMSVPGLNCDDDSSVGFVPSLILPPGASLNISANNPVICYFQTDNLAVGQIVGTQIGIISPRAGRRRVGPVCPDGRGGGVGNPFTINANTPGIYGGIALGPQLLTRGSIFEIRVPVRFTKELKGAAGANGGDKVKFLLDSSVLTPRPATAETWINVPYKAGFEPVSSNVTAVGTTVSSTLNHYFEAGTLSVEYGTSANFGQTSPGASISNANESQPVSTTLTGLTAGATYSYRFKYLTTKGTFYSATATFVASATQPQKGVIKVTVRGLPVGSSASVNIRSVTNLNIGLLLLTIPTDTTDTVEGYSAGGYAIDAGTEVVNGVVYKPNPQSQPITVSANSVSEATVTYSAQPVTNASVTLTVNGLPNLTIAKLSVTNPDGTITKSDVASGTGVNLSDVPPGTYTVNAPDVAVGPNLYKANLPTQTLTVAGGANATFDVLYAIAGPNPKGILEFVTPGLPISYTVFSIGLTYPDGAVISKPFFTGDTKKVEGAPIGAYTVVAPDVIVDGITYRPNPASQPATVNPGTTTTTTIAYTAVPNLLLNTSVTGAGVISSNPLGINCGTTCTANFGQGTTVSLTATAASGSSFSGWGGACSGTGACVVTMDAAKTVSANFVVSSTPTFALTVSKTGNGTISSTPSGINCGSVCTGNYVQGTNVTLTATPVTGSSFGGWGGACSGTGSTCTVSINAIKSVTASFVANSTRSVKKPNNAPADQTISKGSSKNAVAAFAISTSNEKLSSVTLTSTGSGNDASDLSGLHLYRDANANGLVDAGDDLLASGKFADDNGSLTLTPATALNINGETQFVIAADVNTTLAALRFAPVLGSIFLLGFGIRRRWLALIGMTLLLSACGSAPAPVTPNNEARSYQISVSAVNITDSSSTTVNVVGTPIAGATLSVQK
jgi:Divergent InlB B-repeat domain